MLGAFAAFFVLLRLSSKIPDIDSQKISRMYVFCYVSGYFGARLFSIVVEEQVEGPLDFLTKLVTLGPMTFYGGAIFCFLCGVFYSWLKKLNLRNVVDVSFPAGLAALSLGRVGCFLNGDDYGKLTSGQGAQAPWYGVVFPNLGDDASRYPVQLMSSLIVFLLVLFFLKNFENIRQRFGHGFVGLFSVSTYAVGRFFIEFFRGDPRGSVFSGLLSTSQFISLLILCVCIYFMGRLRSLSPAN